jgi:putative ABC transport system permease protein
MRVLLNIALRSAWTRRFGISFIVLSIALSTVLLLAVDRIRTDARDSFSQSVSGTDLVLGARTGSVQLLLYAVFRIGNATNNIRYSSLNAISQDAAVEWVIPISLGDTHRGFAVIGTDDNYFKHYQYGDKRALRLSQGKAFSDVFDVVLGAEVAHQLGYRLGEKLILSHGAGGEMLGNDHADKPFVVVGILERTGTPVDRSLHVSLSGLEAVHLDWIGGVPMPGMAIAVDQIKPEDLVPKTVTAALIGLKSRAAVFSVQRTIAGFKAEPLMAILPGIALDELWTAVGVVEQALMAVSTWVAAVSLAGLVAVVVTGLEQRRRELAVLRSVGARPLHVFTLLLIEGVVITLMGIIIGVVVCSFALLMVSDLSQQWLGVTPQIGWPTAEQWRLMALILGAGTLASLLPGWRAYRMSLADGLSPKG